MTGLGILMASAFRRCFLPLLCCANKLGGKEQPQGLQYATMVNGRESDGCVFGATTSIWRHEALKKGNRFGDLNVADTAGG